MFPKANSVYTFREILKLELRDSPCLSFFHNDKEGCIQNSHLTDENMLSVPGFAETKWKYLYETHEWIPVFVYVGEFAGGLDQFVDLEVYFDPTYQRDEYWVTPKGFPRENPVVEADRY